MTKVLLNEKTATFFPTQKLFLFHEIRHFLLNRENFELFWKSMIKNIPIKEKSPLAPLYQSGEPPNLIEIPHFDKGELGGIFGI
jgi:hypothetical protein